MKLTHKTVDRITWFILSCTKEEIAIPREAGLMRHSLPGGVERWTTSDPMKALKLIDFAEEGTEKLLTAVHNIAVGADLPMARRRRRDE